MPSYNQPKLCPSTTWNRNGITFAKRTATFPFDPFAVFVNTNNTLYVSNAATTRVLIWSQGNVNPVKSIYLPYNFPYSLFVTNDSDGYVPGEYHHYRVINNIRYYYHYYYLYKWTSNSSSVTIIGYPHDQCLGIFVDVSNVLYCSISNHHKVVKRWLGDGSNIWNTIAGTGAAGSSSTTLSLPYGIFVDINYDLYVADCGNDRVQLFHPGQSNAVTIAGNGASNTINLDCPVGIILDADKYLFIVDHNNHRIVGSGPNGFRCLVGCSGGLGSTADRLFYPRSVSFDSYGNIYVADEGNDRIQKFILATNSCGKLNCLYRLKSSVSFDFCSSKKKDLF